MATIGPAGTGVAVAFDAEEAEIIRGLLAEMKQLLGDEHAVDDEVIDRLFPAAYADPADAESFRDLVGEDLRDGKQQAVRSVLSVLGDGGPVGTTVPRSEVDLWLTTLTDLRLALGTRFGVTEEKMSAELDPSGRDAPAMAVLHWMGWIQEMFIRAITEAAGDD